MVELCYDFFHRLALVHRHNQNNTKLLKSSQTLIAQVLITIKDKTSYKTLPFQQERCLNRTT